MAPLPTIPTSFVPHATSVRRSSSDFGGIFGFVAYGILGVVFALAIGVFSYEHILTNTKATKDAELATAESGLDPATVTSFVQLRDRLNSGETLLNNHIALSKFFSAFRSILPASVRFSTLSVAMDPAGIGKISGSGVSKSFNALSVASDAFAADGMIKDAIFSKMIINKDSSVSFDFSATFDSKLVAYTVQGATTASTTP